jgi:copper(I)-binding protein
MPNLVEDRGTVKVRNSPHTRSTLRRCAVAGAAAALALSGCAANFGSETSRVYAPASGVDHRSGGVYVLDASVVANSDGNGTLSATLANQTNSSDALTGVKIESRTREAAHVTIKGGSVDLPAGDAVQLLADNAVVFDAPSLKPGYFVTLRFTFRNAGAFSLNVPVLPNTGDFQSVTMPTPSSSIVGG